MKKKKTVIKNIFAIIMMVILLAGCGDKENQITQEVTETTQEATSTEEVTTQAEKEAVSTEDFVLTLDNVNSWESNDLVCAQYDGIIKNQSGAAASDWKITVTVPEGAQLESNWNGTYAISGTTLTITPVDYNTEIPVDGEISFGFIMDAKEAFTPEKATLSIGGKDYALGGGAVGSSGTNEATEEEATTESKEVATKDISGTPVANHGALSVDGIDIVDKNGKVFQLKGVSTHGINWFPEYVNKDAFSSLAEYGVNAIRLAMYTADYNGYCSGGNQKELENLIDTGVRACSELGMYVIVDWHILNDNDPNQNKDAAKTFFETMSKKYADKDNVIYEICNEPNGGTTWESVKSYAEEIIPIIRQNDKTALIIVGTPTWSQDVDIAAKNPIEGQDNILYAAHFYASTHKDSIRSKVKEARKNGLPVIISECSICEASGNGSINYNEAESWMEMLNDGNISFFAWNLSNKDEQSSLLKPSVTKTGGFTQDDFSETGVWFMEQFGK